jgi:hypothetical protein
MARPRPKGAVSSKKAAAGGSSAIEKARAALAAQFPPRPPAAKATEADWLDLERPETVAVKGRATPPSPFVKAEPAQAGIAERRDVALPRFVRALIERGASDAEILQEAHTRVQRMPTKEGLGLLQALVAEYSRRSGQPSLAREAMGKAHVAPLLGRE